MRGVWLRYGEHGIGDAIMIVVRAAEGRNCGILFGHCLGIPYGTRNAQRYLKNTVPRIACNASHIPDGKGLMRIIAQYILLWPMKEANDAAQPPSISDPDTQSCVLYPRKYR